MSTHSKITIDKAFKDYTDKELVDFHANISALYLGVYDFDRPDLLAVAIHAMSELETRPAAKPYLEAFKKKVFGPDLMAILVKETA